MSMLLKRLGLTDERFLCGGGSSGQTNTNQAQVTQQTTQTTNNITSQQSSLEAAIIADAGNNTQQLIPTPAGIPTVQSVTGETQAQMRPVDEGSPTSPPESLYDPNDTGLLNAFNDAANGTSSALLVAGQVGGASLTANQAQTQASINSSQAETDSAVASAEATASQGINASANGTNLGLGVQASYAPVGSSGSSGTSTAAPATSSGAGFLPLLLLAGGGIAVFYFVKHEHKAA